MAERFSNYKDAGFRVHGDLENPAVAPDEHAGEVMIAATLQAFCRDLSHYHPQSPISLD